MPFPSHPATCTVACGKPILYALPMSSGKAVNDSAGGSHQSAEAFDWYPMLAVMVAASAVLAPFFFLGNASGHDFDFHIASWMDVARQWQAGVWYPRWAVWANYGFGEPRFIFYPPASWLLGAALGTLLPWQAAPGAFIWLALGIAGAAMLRLAREWLPPWEAAVAAVVYAVNPYHLAIVYWRSDFAELLASAVFPLLVLYAGRLAHNGSKAVAPLALVFASIWLANAPAGVIASYALAVLLVFLAVIHRAPQILARGAAAILLGLLLAAFYIVPAAFEQRWVAITQALSSGLRPEQNFLFTSISDPEHNLFNLKISSVAAAVGIAAALASVFFPRQPVREREAWRILAALGLVSIVLMFPISEPAWRYLPELRFVQFPWRWLVALNLVSSVFCAAAFSGLQRKWLGPLLLGTALAATGAAMVPSGWWDTEDVPVVQSAIQQGEGYEGTDEYEPAGCDRYDLPHKAPEVSVANGPGHVGEKRDVHSHTATRSHILKWSPELKSIAVDSAKPTKLALRLVDYPAWHAEVNGRPTPVEAKKGTAQMLIPVPAGHTLVHVRFIRTRDRTAGIGLSCFAAVVLAALSKKTKTMKPTTSETQRS